MIMENTELDWDSMRMEGDELADQIHSSLPANAQEKKLVQLIMNSPNGTLTKEAACRMERIRHLFTKYFPFTGLILLCGSLPAAYSAAKGAETLKCTGRMYEEPKVRILETTLFLHRIFEHQYYDHNLGRVCDLEKHPGFRAIAKVRLLHARVRSHLKDLPKEVYNLDENGVPINQEDLLGTLHVFSYVVLHGLERLGFKISDKDKDDFMHFWRQVGIWIGVSYKMQSFAQEEANFRKIMERHSFPSNYSKAIVQQLFEKISPPKCSVRQRQAISLYLKTLCWMLDEKLARRLELEYSVYYKYKWYLYILLFKMYLVVDYIYQRFSRNGLSMFPVGEILGDVAATQMKALGVAQPFMFRVVVKPPPFS
uniref:ER-bound oxygenase mpaB/mpaB'/Rubber oxygenase catalytic domain-containing protein n=1 Tax=Fibrocapsa japonica TaxID=94617 RepID=A0A7S2UUN3_9STRA|mmetsp:Transcript_14377/g.21157  ORF Transcript_14377/g.21157 Transcript_14377/m.21157 type:complete len:368 (+) Transcript_14377:63-1166(+)